MSAHLSNLLGEALGTPDPSRPAKQHEDSKAAQPPYGSPQDVAQRIEQYLAHVGRTNSATQLLYEALKALRAPTAAAGDAQIAAYGLPDGTRVERAVQSDASHQWAVRRNGDCLGRNGHWSYEPQPSSRSQEWLALHRFPTAQAAINATIAAQQGY